DCSPTVEIEARCLLAFVCPTPVNRATDLTRLQSEAQRLATAYGDCSTGCFIASCVAGIGTPSVCDATTGRCQIQTAIAGGAR
ncbi:MAG TPA: hypothetical protein VMF89_10135, partial [Polyangiales bacterium]|nr:hypothetical protein [Polyangiales bacterium]